MDLIKSIENEFLKEDLPSFGPGDTVKVNVKVSEGNRERIQTFEGVIIAINGVGVNKTITVRKLSFGVGVERIFPVHAPIVDSIEVIRKGKVRRAKLYYLRDRTGKSARIAEKIKKKIGIDVETKIQQVTEENVLTATEENVSEAPKQEASKEEVKKEPAAEAPNKEEKKEEPKKESPEEKK